jgi:hypothetical protein
MAKKEKGINIKNIKNNHKKININIFKGIHKNSKIIILATLVLFLAVFLNFLFRRYLAASVNGKFITRTELFNELVKADSGKTLDNLITKEIIFQEAKNNNIKIDNSVIDSEIAKISDSLSGQGTNISDALTQQGLTMKDLVENIRIQKILENILGKDITINDDEISKKFEDTKSSYPAGTKFEDVKSQVKDQIFQEKLSTAYQTWIAQKRSSYKIKYYLK